MDAFDDTFRCFAAVPVSDEVKALLDSFIAHAGDLFPDYRFGASENLHITLQFLGDVPRSLLPSLKEAVSSAARGVPPFRLGCRRAGGFPERGAPRILHIAVTQGAESLRALADRVRRNFRSLGYSDPKPFVPHVTLGRARNRQGFSGRGQNTTNIRSSWEDSYMHFLEVSRGQVEWEVREVLLMESVLLQQGPAYTPVARVELRE